MQVLSSSTDDEPIAAAPSQPSNAVHSRNFKVLFVGLHRADTGRYNVLSGRTQG